MEYLIIMGIALLFASPLILQAQQALVDVRDTGKASTMSQSLDAIEEGASLVYAQGSPAKVSFSVRIPEGVSKSNVTGQYLLYELERSDGRTTYTRSLGFDVQGKLPEQEGRYIIVTRAQQNYVNISYQ